MGVECVDNGPQSAYAYDDYDDDDDDDPEAALNPCADENDTVAPLRLRRLAQGGADAGSAFPPGPSNVMSVYVTMHR